MLDNHLEDAGIDLNDGPGMVFKSILEIAELLVNRVQMIDDKSKDQEKFDALERTLTQALKTFSEHPDARRGYHYGRIPEPMELAGENGLVMTFTSALGRTLRDELCTHRRVPNAHLRHYYDVYHAILAGCAFKYRNKRHQMEHWHHLYLTELAKAKGLKPPVVQPTLQQTTPLALEVKLEALQSVSDSDVLASVTKRPVQDKTGTLTETKRETRSISMSVSSMTLTSSSSNPLPPMTQSSSSHVTTLLSSTSSASLTTGNAMNTPQQGTNMTVTPTNRSASLSLSSSAQSLPRQGLYAAPKDDKNNERSEQLVRFSKRLLGQWLESKELFPSQSGSRLTTAFHQKARDKTIREINKELQHHGKTPNHKTLETKILMALTSFRKTLAEHPKPTAHSKAYLENFDKYMGIQASATENMVERSIAKFMQEELPKNLIGAFIP